MGGPNVREPSGSVKRRRSIRKSCRVTVIRRGTDGGGTPLGEGGRAAPRHDRPVVHPILPHRWHPVGFGDSVFLLMPEDGLTSAGALLLLGNLNSFGFDSVTRQKAAGTNLGWYVVEQLPGIAPERYERTFGDTTARELVRDHVLRLTYTARDLGYDGPPFVWNIVTCAPGSTRRTSTSTACRARTQITLSTPSPSLAGTMKPSSAATARAPSSSPT